MATATPQESTCSLVKVGTLELQTEVGSEPVYNGVVVTEDMLLVIDNNAWNLQLYSLRDGKLMCTSQRLKNYPRGICLISKKEVAVCLADSTIVMLSFESIDDVKLVKTLDVRTGFNVCQSLAKLNSDKLVVSGRKMDGGWMLYLCVVNLTDGRVDSTHNVGFGYVSHLAIKNDTVYISCRTEDSTVKGVYACDIFKPHKTKFLYQHHGLWTPYSLMVDEWNFIYVCDLYSNSIHQLTDSGQLVTIHTVSSSPYGIFYDDQHGVLYTTSLYSNVITLYRLEYSHQLGVPIEILKMDDKSIQLFEEALKDGKETVYNIRIMVVGHTGVGKTTLVRRLLGEEVNISDRCSTEGIDVYVNCCDVSLSNCEWIRRSKDSEQDYRLQRLARVLNDQQTMKDNSTQKEQVIIPHQGETTHNSHEVAHVAVEDKESEVQYIHSSQHDVGQDLSSTHCQPEESPTALAQAVTIQPETNMVAMLKLLQKNVYKLKLDKEETSPLTIWDFAGQYAFYTTHQTFLTRRAIYLLVSDVSQQLTDLVADECYFDSDGIMKCKVHELTDVWLNSIHSCALSPEARNPPVILVGTHVDKVSQINHREICEKYFRKIRTYLKDKPTRFHLVNEDFAIDNTIVDSKLQDLKRKIVEVALQQPYWGEQIPARWLPLEQELMRLKTVGIKVINWSLLDELNRSLAIPMTTDELDLFLRFQHDIGTILYFSMDILKENIVLDPQWIIDALKSLITAEMLVLRNIPAVTVKWFEFKEKGKLSRELVDSFKAQKLRCRINFRLFMKRDITSLIVRVKQDIIHFAANAVWTQEKHLDLHVNKEHILLLMEQLNIIAKVRLYNEETSEIKEEDYFLAPCMLRQETPREVIHPVAHHQMESSSVLCYVFVGKYLPSPIFHRLLAACVAHWPIATKINNGTLENLIFCGCCVFQLDHYHKLTIHFWDYIIYMRVTRKGITDKTPSTKLCIEAREFVSANLIKIIGCLGQRLKFKQFIQCPEYKGDSVNSLIPVSLLKENQEVCCPCHDNITESKKLLQFWFDDMPSQGDKGEDTVKQEKVYDILSECQSPREKGGDTENTDVQVQILPQVNDVTAKTVTIPCKTYLTKGVPFSDPKLLSQILNRSQQATSSSQSILEVNCLSVGLELYYNTTANGNCFFEAVSSQLQRLNCGVQKSPQQLRQEVVAFMRTNRALHGSEGTIYLDRFIYGETFEDYCTRMTRDGEWADHVVVVAMARKLQMDIMIVTSIPSAGPEDIIVWVVGKTGFHGNPILLGHIWESHYLSLQPKAPASFLPVQVDSFAPATTDVPTPSKSLGSTPDEALESMVSLAVGPSATRTSVTQHLATYGHKPSPTGSTPSTTRELVQAQTPGTTPSTTTESTTAEVKQASASDFITTPVMQIPPYASTFDVMPAAASSSTPSTTDGLTQFQTYVSAASQTYSSTTATSSLTISSVTQTPNTGSTTTNFMPVLTLVSTLSSTTVSNPSTTFISTIAAGMQTATFRSTKSDVMQAPVSCTKISTTADLMLAQASSSTAADFIQAQTLNSEQSTTVIAGSMLVSTSSSPIVVVMQAPITVSLPSTTAGLMQASASSSTSADVMQPPVVEDTDRFMHIACLLVNVGSRVLRRLLLYHTVTPVCTLDQYLANNRIDIDDLRKRKILNTSQMDILFPTGGSTNLGDYDITLLSALFTNIVLTVSQQELNMVQFLRDKRNEIFAHAKSVAVNSNDYQTFWNDICRTLEALSKQCNDPDFENEISRVIQGIQVSTVQGTSFFDTLQTHPRRIETLERLVQALISSQTQESNKAADNNDL